VLLTESTTPLMAAGFRDGVVEPHVLRRRIDIATFPGDRVRDALRVLHALYPELQAAESPLQTGLESMNLLVHPGLALANLGGFDRAEAEGRGFSFYTEGNTRHAGLLTEALDAERRAVCRAYGLREASVLDRLRALYGARGATFQEAVADCGFFQRLGELPAGVWRRWLSVDVPFAVVPCVRLAEAAGVPAPLHRAVADVFGALLGIDPWKQGLTLERLGLAGLAPEALARRLRAGNA
jgi:opine dehydrogenase